MRGNNFDSTVTADLKNQRRPCGYGALIRGRRIEHSECNKPFAVAGAEHTRSLRIACQPPRGRHAGGVVGEYATRCRLRPLRSTWMAFRNSPLRRSAKGILNLPTGKHQLQVKAWDRHGSFAQTVSYSRKQRMRATWNEPHGQHLLTCQWRTVLALSIFKLQLRTQETSTLCKSTWMVF